MTATLQPTTAASGAKSATGASPADVVRKAKEAGVQVVDLRFTDLPGTWQHLSIPLKELTEDLFADGIGFDGSSTPRRESGTRGRTAPRTWGTGRDTRRATSRCRRWTGCRISAPRSCWR